MSTQSAWGAPMRVLAWIIGVVVVAVVIGGFAFTDVPQRLGLLPMPSGDGHGGDEHAAHGDADAHAEHDHAAHDHDHEGHSEVDSIELTAQARANMRLQIEPVSVSEFTDYIDVPAVIVDWPGRTHFAITAPMTGVINAIDVSRGELISSGAKLFSLRLTHQDLVSTQETFLTLLGKLDVEQREINRLTSIANSGAIAGKTLLTREYERDKLLADIRTARQSLLLHGLSEEQIQSIEQTRELVREIDIYAPTLHSDRSLHHDSLGEPTQPEGHFASTAQPTTPSHPDHIKVELLVTQLMASPGESVNAGEKLAQLSDYSQVLIEGHAFQRDGDALRKAAEADLPLQAVVELSSGRDEVVQGLGIVYIGNEVDRQSRALPFYVSLENQVERSEQRGSQRYVSWRFKPGQRLRLRVPTASFDDAIVVPKMAVAEEGPERYVFIENGDHFDRIPVHVLARDSMNVAIANDGQLWPGQSIAVSGAHQLQMALKNKSGGAIDPHAGHNH